MYTGICKCLKEDYWMDYGLWCFCISFIKKKEVMNNFFNIIYLFDNALHYLEMLTDLWQIQDFQ